ncbi:hypothetical protein, partial [Klebsiella pneumoniae]|uniref:hypothetical protein n=1 Tax=Klebsiella pneumoniae TaxID=573 RepID=UPI001A930358
LTLPDFESSPAAADRFAFRPYAWFSPKVSVAPIVHIHHFIALGPVATATAVGIWRKTRTASEKSASSVHSTVICRVTKVSINTAEKSTSNICTASHFAR